MPISFIQKLEGKTGPIYKAHYSDPLTGKRRCKNHRRRKDAQAFLESPKVTGELTAPVKTIAEATDHWLHVCEHKGRKGREPVAKHTLRQYKGHARYIKSALIGRQDNAIRFGDILLGNLADEHCEAFRDQLLSDFTDRGYAKKHLTSFKSILDQARCDKLMSHQPAENVFIRSASREPDFKIEDDNAVPQLHEIQLLLKTLRERVHVSNKQLRRRRRRYKLIFETIAFGGTRPGEALGLPWHEVYFDRGGIRITQDVEEDGTIGKPKSKSAYRFIAMPAHYMRQLRWWKKLCPPSKENLVFPNWSGNVDFLSNMNARGWQPLLKAAGLVHEDETSRYEPKSLRHARASLEIHEGANPKEIQTLMGHSSIKVTYDIYGHLFDAHNDRRADRANLIAHTLLNRTSPEHVTNM